MVSRLPCLHVTPVPTQAVVQVQASSCWCLCLLLTIYVLALLAGHAAGCPPPQVLRLWGLFLSAHCCGQLLDDCVDGGSEWGALAGTLGGLLLCVLAHCVARRCGSGTVGNCSVFGLDALRSITFSLVIGRCLSLGTAPCSERTAVIYQATQQHNDRECSICRAGQTAFTAQTAATSRPSSSGSGFGQQQGTCRQQRGNRTTPTVWRHQQTAEQRQAARAQRRVCCHGHGCAVLHLRR